MEDIKKIIPEYNFKIPKQITVNGTVYTVSVKDRLTADRAAMGESCCNSCWISIDSAIDRQQQRRTILHEIIEILNIDNELKVHHNVISVLEAQLFQIFSNDENVRNFVFDGT